MLTAYQAGLVFQRSRMSHKPSVYLMFVVCFVADLLAVAVANEEDCVSNYNDFQDATLSKSTSNRFELHRVFYPPNGRKPYSVEVTYQTTLSNGTVEDIITDGAGYRNKVWVWLSSPVFVHARPEFLNLLTLKTLNNFENWVPPKVNITVPCPCKNTTFDFLEAMTSSLADYSAGRFEVKVHKGNVVVVNVNPGLSYLYPSKTKFNFLDSQAIYTMWACELSFLSVFLWAVSFALIKPRVREFVDQMTHYSYQYYGLAWGGCIVALGLMIAILYGMIAVLMEGKPNVPQQYVTYLPYWCFGILFCAPGIPIAVYFAYKTTPPPVPYMFLLPAALLCCCKKMYARSVVFGLGLFIYMMGIQCFLCMAILLLLLMFAEPLLIITNTFIIILLVFCLSNILALLFTISAYIFTVRGSRRMQKSSTIIKAALLVPLFAGISSFCLVLAASGGKINDNPSSILPIIGSAILPIMLGTLMFTLKKLVLNVVEEVPYLSLSGDVATSSTSLLRHDTLCRGAVNEP